MADYEQRIREILGKTFCPTLLEIEDESGKHAGHAGISEHGGGHFTVHIVATCFRGKTRVERHRMIHESLGDAFKAGIHALSIKAKTPEEAR